MRKIVRTLIDEAKRKASPKNSKHACKIMITCGTPCAKGNMDVEMTYEGDPCLAAYLIESAQGFVRDAEFVE